jgi:flagellar hook protein FlgE
MTMSLFNGLSGLSAHQKMLDVISNNIANLNTNGFKRSDSRLAEGFSEMLTASTAPTASLGGTNPLQIGRGVRLGAFSVDFNQGTMEGTGRSLDMAIQGDGFFVLGNGAATKYYSRVGSFALDSDYSLVDQATGFHVQSTTGNITVPKDDPLPPRATGSITLRGNLDPTTVVAGSPIVTSIQVMDSRGQAHRVELSLTKTGPMTWGMSAALPDSDGVFSDNQVDGITFNEDGSFAGVTGGGAGDNDITLTFNGLTTPQTISFALGTASGFDGLTQLGGESTAAAVDQDGYEAGSLLSLSVKPDGALSGQYSNGRLLDLSQLVIATFPNAEGLEKVNDNMYQESANSGQAILGKGLSGRAGSVLGGNLEGSNVDVSKEMALMIVAQRGFQVNARVITVSNEILQEIADLVR